MWHTYHNRYRQEEAIHESIVSYDYFSSYKLITKRFITPDDAYNYCMVRILI